MNYKIFKRMLKYITAGSQIGILLVAVASTLLGIAMPLLYAYIIDKVLIVKESELLIKSLSLFILIIIMQMIISFFQSLLVSKFGEKVGKSIRKDMYEKIVTLDMETKNELGSANILSLFNNDVFQVTGFISTIVYNLILQIFTLLAISGLMLWMSVKLTLSAFSVIPFFFLLLLIMGRKVRINSERRQETFVDINVQLQEDIKGMSSLQIEKAIAYRKQKFVGLIDFFFENNVRLSALSSFTNQMATLLASAGEIIVICVGGYMYINSDITLGVIIAFLNYVGRVFTPIIELMTMNQKMQSAVPSLTRIFDFLDKSSKIIENEKAEEIKGKIKNIRLENISLSYDCENNVLDNLNLSLETGKYIAFVGASGSGKTSICNILTRFINLSSGEVYVNGQNINNISLKSLRKKIYLMIQEPIIYSGSIRDNIALGEKISEKKLEEAIDLVCLRQLVNDKRLDINIGEDGFSLSGGEIRRIALARAITRDYDVLILDEPTNGIDNLNKRIIIKNLKELSRNEKLVIVISHNPEDFVSADEIVLIKDGAIASIGTHSDLMNQNKYYNKIVNMKGKNMQSVKA